MIIFCHLNFLGLTFSFCATGKNSIIDEMKQSLEKHEKWPEYTEKRLKFFISCFIEYANNKGADQPVHSRSWSAPSLFAAWTVCIKHICFNLVERTDSSWHMHTKAQIMLHIRAVYSTPLLFAAWIVAYAFSIQSGDLDMPDWYCRLLCKII